MVDSSLITCKIQSQLLDPDEYVMVCEPIKKLRAVGAPDDQDRLYLMTTDRIYTFKSQLKSRIYYIKDVGAILQSTQNENDFFIFFERFDDLVISSPNRKDLLDLLKLRFNCLNRNTTLRVYGVTNQQLLMYHRNNNSTNKSKRILDLPEDQQRVLALEIKGEDEYNQSLKWGGGNVEDTPFD